MKSTKYFLVDIYPEASPSMLKRMQKGRIMFGGPAKKVQCFWIQIFTLTGANILINAKMALLMTFQMRPPKRFWALICILLVAKITIAGIETLQLSIM